MKVETQKVFTPITITIETKEEAALLYLALNASTNTLGSRHVKLPDNADEIMTRMFNEISFIKDAI